MEVTVITRQDAEGTHVTHTTYCGSSSDACTLEPAGRRHGAPDALLDPHVHLWPERDAAGEIVDFTCMYANDAAAEYLGVAPGNLAGARLLDFLPQAAASEMLPQLVRTAETGQPIVLEDHPYFSELFACERRYDLRVLRMADGLSCTWCDVTQRYEVEECLRRRVSELDAIHRISQLLAARTDLPGALAAAGRVVDELFGARSSRILILPDGEEARTSEHLETASQAGAVAMPCEASVVDEALVARRPVLSEACDEVGRHVLAVPLVTRSRLLGVLTVVREPEARHFTAHEVTVAESVADALAAAVENERLHLRAAREAAEGERQRLARDLHDSVTQTLYSANLIAEVLPDVAVLDSEGGLEGLDKLRRLMRTALCEMRTLLFELRPETLDSASLESLLERLGDALAGHDGTLVEIDVEEPLELPTTVKLAFYRVAQEALTNISKHAHAGHVAIDVRTGPEGVRLTVADDGRGFDLDEVGPGSMGLRIMRERAEEAGATLDVESDSERGGTRVTVEWVRDAVLAMGG